MAHGKNDLVHTINFSCLFIVVVIENSFISKLVHTTLVQKLFAIS